MKTFVISLALLILTPTIFAQSHIFGIVTDSKGNSLPGATVYLRGTYDGTSANDEGMFRFETKEIGNHVIIVSYLGFNAAEREVVLGNSEGEEIIENFSLYESSVEIGGVVITAGTFETSDRKRSVTLQPLDIVTTPSAVGDIYGALSTLPGTSPVGEDGRLFVRGGDGYETKTFIDGLLVKKPYSSNVPNLPSRGRFSPFLFTGTTFSTGGYSAEYGQALSSALILTTNSFPKKTQTEISVMSVGGGVTQTFKGKNSSLSLGFEYINLTPYQSLVPSDLQVNKHPESLGFTMTSRHRFSNNGILKVFGTYSNSRFGVKYPDQNHKGQTVDVSIANQNSYTNASYTSTLGNWLLKSGVAFSFDNNNLDLESFFVKENTRNFQAKASLKREFSKNLTFLFGLEQTYNRFYQDYQEAASGFEHKSQFEDFLTAIFAETEIKPTGRFAIRAGLRAEHSSLLKDTNLATRLSAAFLINGASQVSVAYGNFFQTPEESLLRFTHNLTFEKANHYILNYQWEKNDRLFRVEGYLKDYKKLVTYKDQEFWNGNHYSNDGQGFARGIDVFFRDRRSLKTMEYWVSYSFVDSKRRYRHYPETATPNFVANHVASLVVKKWVQGISTQFGLSATFASGRPYNNPNNTIFMDCRTPYYNDVSFNVSHLTTVFKKPAILYFSVSNLLGRNNVFGYRYYNQPNELGTYEAIPIKPDSKRFFMLVFLLTV